MKWVKLKSSFAGKINMPAGSLQEFEDGAADRLIDLGHAEEAEAPIGEKPSSKRSKRTQKGKESR